VSESFSHVLYPFEIARRPSIEPEVRRAILARWSSNLREGSDNSGVGNGRAGKAPSPGLDTDAFG
jgi:hypothetical protein